MKKYLRNWIIYIVVVIVICFLIGIATSASFEKAQVMNKLEYLVKLNEDGSMNVTEIWDVYVKNTGTLFKDFYNTNKYPISDVYVKNLNTNESLRNLEYYIYNVPEGSYYAENIDYDTVEVAFGTGKSYSSGNVKFQISYKIENVINSYTDCQEFYWKFLDESNNIPCKRIEGKITLAKNVNDIENLKVWGHGNINGEINRTSTNEVEFYANNLNSGNMIEVRIVTADKIFNVQNNVFNYRMLNNIITEENQWSIDTNADILTYRIFFGILILIYIVILICIIKNFVTYFKIGQENNDGIERTKIQYFRDIPREGDSTPGEAAFLYYFTNNFNWTDGKQSDVVAANILNLCLKGYIAFEKYKKRINISIVKTGEGLKNDEKEIYKLIKDAIGNNDYIEVEDLKNFAKERFDTYSNHVTRMISNIKKNLYEEEIIDKRKEKLYDKSNSIVPIVWAGIIFLIIIYNAIGLIPMSSLSYIIMWGIDTLGIFLDSVIILLPIAIMLILLDMARKKAKNNIYKLTQKGANEKEEWEGLARFLKDYSKIDEKGAFDIVIWEKYLVFATAFGMEEKVIDELHSKYPYVFTEGYWQEASEKYTTRGIIDMACNPIYVGTNCNFSNFTSTIHSSYRTMTSTLTAHYASSGGGFSAGGGGGFSSGGGGRWRRTVGMGGR